jgi:hypothetical protein
VSWWPVRRQSRCRRLVRPALPLSAHWWSELGASDVLAGNTNQDCSDSSNPSEHGHDRDPETAPLPLKGSRQRCRRFPLRLSCESPSEVGDVLTESPLTVPLRYRGLREVSPLRGRTTTLGSGSPWPEVDFTPHRWPACRPRTLSRNSRRTRSGAIAHSTLTDFGARNVRSNPATPSTRGLRCPAPPSRLVKSSASTSPVHSSSDAPDPTQRPDSSPSPA